MSRQRAGAPRGPRVNARNQFLICALAGCVALGIALASMAWQAAIVTGWDVAAATWIVWTAVIIVGKDAEATREVALAEDDSRVTRDVMLIGASLASLVGVVLVLLKAAPEKGAAHVVLTALGAGTVIVSWTSVHLLFALRYARLYHGAGSGIDFHDDRLADYGDFAYVAFTIGMTYQVSDTDLTAKPIRMTALRHALLSYLFGTAVIATMINVVAGLLSK